MADNYLEKRYERYQERKAAWEKARKHQQLLKKVASKKSSPATPTSDSKQ